MNVKLIYIFFGIFFCSYISLYAQKHRYVTFSTVNARPVGMGGAFVSIEDDLPAINYNPACFQLFRTSNRPKWTFFLNPIPPALIFNHPEDFDVEQNSITGKLTKSLALFLKGLAFSYSVVNIGFLSSEELVDYENEKGEGLEELFKDYKNFNDNHYYSVALSLNLSRNLSLGVTGNLFSLERTVKGSQKIGASYGILLK